MNLLVVDDNPANRLLVSMMGEDLGWCCVEADSGGEAVSLLKRIAVDVVLLDISMPGMSGEDVCRQIKSDPALPKPRVVAYTAHVLPDEIQTIMHAGFDGFLSKPFTEAQLLNAVLPQSQAPG
jgi:CheY-like chemotaxis protein